MLDARRAAAARRAMMRDDASDILLMRDATMSRLFCHYGAYAPLFSAILLLRQKPLMPITLLSFSR